MTPRSFRIVSACWCVASLFMLAYWAQHIVSCQSPCRNHWGEVAFHVFILIAAMLGVRGSRHAFLVLIVNAVIVFLWCVTDLVVCVMVDELAFRFLSQPVTGTILGLATLITFAVVKKKERTEPAPGHVPSTVVADGGC